MVICALFWVEKSKKWRISAGLRVFLWLVGAVFRDFFGGGVGDFYGGG